jgi:acyl-CoA synthetase (AMP-forming)/AMP-acid ligase II
MAFYRALMMYSLLCHRRQYRNIILHKNVLTMRLLLRRRDAQAGDRVLLVYPPSLHFIVAFLACLR